MEDQSASYRPIQNQGPKLWKGGPERAVPLWLRKEIQTMLRPQLTGEFSLDATSSPRKVLHCLDSEIRIDADPSRILFRIRISTAGPRISCPPFGAQSHRWQRSWYYTNGNAGGPSLKPFSATRGMTPTASSTALKCAPSKPQHATERPRATFPGGLHLVCATRLAQMTRGPRIANLTKGSGGVWCVQMNFDAPAALCPTERPLK
jgi:hypothetical protein